MRAFVTSTRAWPERNAMIRSRFVPSGSFPATDTQSPSSASAIASCSSFSPHHTIHGPGVVSTNSTTRSARGLSDSRRALVRPPMPPSPLDGDKDSPAIGAPVLIVDEPCCEHLRTRHDPKELAVVRQLGDVVWSRRRGAAEPIGRLREGADQPRAGFPIIGFQD